MRTDVRSGCPISLSLEVFGDRWTLLVLRDVIFGGSRHFRELLDGPERISSNILADRLAALVDHGLLTRSDDPTHKQKVTYSLTEPAIQLVPVLAWMSAWGLEHLPAKDPQAAAARVLVDGGPDGVGGVHGRPARAPPRRRCAARPAPDGPSLHDRMAVAARRAAVPPELARVCARGGLRGRRSVSRAGARPSEPGDVVEALGHGGVADEVDRVERTAAPEREQEVGGGAAERDVALLVRGDHLDGRRART